MKKLIYILLVYSAMLVFWKPNPGPQTEVLRRSEDEILFGGSRGGGKTVAGMVWMVEPAYIANPRYQGLVIRKNSDDLSDWIERARHMYRPTRATFAGNPPKIRFPSGALIRTGHLKDKNAYTKYQGHEYQKILIEELTQIPRELDYEMLWMSNRSTVPGLKAQMFCTANPGGKGHAWVKRRWVDVAGNKTYWHNTAEGKFSRIFIPSRVYDTPQLLQNDPKYVAMLDSLPEDLRRAWKDGDWDVFAGQYFSKWRRDRHVIAPFKIPHEWPKYRGYDHGYAAPTAVVWIAVDQYNNHYLYRELYVKETVPSIIARKTLEYTGQ
ncbi:phage terminase large subunit, partial [candidate division KSB1 bacterium]|nr:phage terminase large subunit [candidate division KSB1 bacterium]